MRKRMCAALLAVMMLLCACGVEDDPYRVDTVVRIPVDPTETPTEEPTEAVQTEPARETEAATEEPTEEPTEAAKSTGVKKSTSTQKSTSKKNTSTGKANTKATEPKETKPKETKPRETKPEATEPEQTQPPVTEPEQTKTAETEPEETEAPETQPPETQPQLYDISGYSVSSLGKSIRSEINALRKAEDVKKLSLDSRLSAIASCRAWELSQVWSHTRPDGRGYYTVLGDYGYGAGAVTELLVYGSADAEAIVAQWAASDSHLEKLLSESYSVIGIGEYSAGGVLYICVLLAG